MIVLSSNNDSTYKQRRKYLQATMKVLTSNDESTYKPQSSLYRLLPHYGITLPLTRAIICYCLAQNDTSGAFFIKAPLSFLLFTLHQIG